ncbi:S-layer homology domain-containing protein [Bacillus sp. 1P06AnD]|uniref:S-layer homology domain-containing protein n=1 Tax=Bacillus sp. 1P06AnD TaxID=3132208 RepID=UPI0039A265FB
MQKVKKQKKWWKRSLAAMFSLTLMTSSLSMTGVPERVNAANSLGPGGVTDATLWLRPDKGINENSGKVTLWQDQSSKMNHATADTASIQPTYLENGINFNPALQFDGKNTYMNLDVSKLPTGKRARSVVAVAKTSVTAQKTIISWGTEVSNKMFGLVRNGDQARMIGYGSDNGVINTFWDANVNELTGTWEGDSGDNTASIYSKMKVKTNISQSITSWDTSSDPNANPKAVARIGARIENTTQSWNGLISDVIVFDRVLTDVERHRISSYLAVKYGYTLDQTTPTNYLASNGTKIIWNAENNKGYGNRITVIGKDTGSDLVQKQSKSTEESGNVTIALGNDIATSNKANSSSVAEDKTFLTFSDNGAEADYTIPLADNNIPATLAHANPTTQAQVKMMPRIYKVDKSADWTDLPVTLQVDGADPTKYSIYLYMSDDPNFSTSTVTVKSTDKTTGKVTLNSRELGNGSYFTFVIQVDKRALETLTNKIEKENLQENSYTPASWKGLQNALTNANIILTDTNATPEQVDEALKVLKRAEEDLVHTSAVDKSKLEAKVTEVSNLKAIDYTPASWKGLQDALTNANIKLTDTNATQEQVNEALKVLKKAEEDLVLTSAVDKSKLEAKVTEVSNLKAIDYTPASWKGLQDALTNANIILTDTNATQEQVNEALKVLKKAEEGLVLTSAVDKSKLQIKVNEGNKLISNHYTPSSWGAYTSTKLEAEEVLKNPNATQREVDAVLTKLTSAQNTLVKVPAETPGLDSLTSSTGTLSPIFSSEVTNYTMNVEHTTSQLSFKAVPFNQGAKVTMTANGQAVNMGDFFPLSVGENTVMITVTDDTGSKTYVITVNYTKDTSSGSGNGGGTSTSTPPMTETNTTTKIKVDLDIDGANPMEKIPVEIERTKHANGQITDFVALTEANAKEAVQKAKQIGNNITRIVIPDANDEVDKVTVEVPKQSIQMLRENGLSFEISTDNAYITIPVSSMDGVNDNLHFRFLPVKKESERKAIEERARVEKLVYETLQSNDVRVVARPMKIETNMPSRPVQVTLPLKGVKVPTAKAERQVFLEHLAVFIEYSDGEKKIVFPEFMTMANGELGLRFTVDKFSTFTVIQFEKSTVGKHEAYINGFPNGTFGPEENVTRVQVATMIARILGYTDDQTVDYAPFNDIPSNHYAAGAIAFIKERGIMNGNMNGNFRASDNITRAQMATVVANYKQLQIEEGVTITFNDTKDHWAQWIIEANRTAGIINGYEDGSFAPNKYLTRAQAVVIMNRMFERGPLNSVTTPSFPDVKGNHWAFKDIEEAAKSHVYFIDEDKNEQLSK